MSLITCPECGKVFSDRAAHCPQCGLPTSEALGDIIAANSSNKHKQQATTTQCDLHQTPSLQSPKQSDAQQPHYEQHHNPIAQQQADNIQPNQPTPPRKPTNLLTYFLIIAVACLAIVCVLLLVNYSGSSKSSSVDDSDSLGATPTLPADTLVQQTRQIQHETQPVSLPQDNEEDIDASQDAVVTDNTTEQNTNTTQSNNSTTQTNHNTTQPNNNTTQTNRNTPTNTSIPTSTTTTPQSTHTQTQSTTTQAQSTPTTTTTRSTTPPHP